MPTAKKKFETERLPREIQAIADNMNIDIGEVPSFTIPELPLDAGISGAEFKHRICPRILKTFEEEMYGPIPPRCAELLFEVTAEGYAFDRLAIRREIDIVCRNRGRERILHMLLYIPTERRGKVPVFFGLNFCGNHITTHDPGVTFHPFVPLPLRRISRLDQYDNENGSWRPRLVDRRKPEEQRGEYADRWNFEKVLRHGFASATIDYEDIFIDRLEGFEQSIMSLFYDQREWDSPERKIGAISAWAWGISRGIDCLEAQEEIDRTKICVHGHSRLGKTSLWAGANDSRIALTIANCSGTGGAKLAHHWFGESFAWLDLWNEHWFNSKFKQWVDKEREMPFDQHFLMAAIAPRLLYVASGTLDVYADPQGEYLAARAASPAWRLFGGRGLADTEFPPPGKLIGREVGYYLRDGRHDFTSENWDALLAFSERYFK